VRLLWKLQHYYEIVRNVDRDNNFCHYYVIHRNAGFAITLLHYHPAGELQPTYWQCQEHRLAPPTYPGNVHWQQLRAVCILQLALMNQDPVIQIVIVKFKDNK
jgi:hypothetical protein